MHETIPNRSETGVVGRGAGRLYPDEVDAVSMIGTSKGRGRRRYSHDEQHQHQDQHHQQYKQHPQEEQHQQSKHHQHERIIDIIVTIRGYHHPHPLEPSACASRPSSLCTPARWEQPWQGMRPRWRGATRSTGRAQGWGADAKDCRRAPGTAFARNTLVRARASTGPDPRARGDTEGYTAVPVSGRGCKPGGVHRSHRRGIERTKHSCAPKECSLPCVAACWVAWNLA